jgi:predicted HicB family RNase H-like nuclease
MILSQHRYDVNSQYKENAMNTSKKPKKTTSIENQTKFAFRLTDELYKQLEKSARKNGRSMNSQLTTFLVSGLEADGFTVSQD